MMTKKISNALVLIVFSFFLYQCANPENQYILLENFDNNKLGWPEEKTGSHDLYIKKGVYHIDSKDTSKYLSSVYSLDDKYLIDLPNKYVVSTSIDLKKRTHKKRDITNFGLLLNSSSLEYEFSIYWHGLVKVTEYDNNTDSTITIFERQLKEIKSPTLIDLKISDTNFELLVNGNSIGKDKFKTKTKSWVNLRLYTTTGSLIEVDYLKILKTK